jgi:hypothetical protein
MFTAQIKDIKSDVIQSSQTPFLDVEVDILDEQGAIVETRKFGYSADTSEEAIKEDLARFLRTYSDDMARTETNKEADELNEKANATIEALKGESIEL